jgi:hypothetical protein
MYIKWYERRLRPPLYLTLVFSFLTLALTMLSIGIAEAAITGFYKEVYRFSLPFGYIMVIFADIFLFQFAIEITNKGKNLFPYVILLAILIGVFLALPWNWWGVPQEDYTGQINIRLYSTLSLVIFSYLVYGYIAVICRKVRKELDKKVMYFGLTLLFYSMISLMLLFLMLIADTLMIILFNHPGYSEFTYIAWIFGIIFIILIYLSLVMPDWLVNWINKRYKI